MRAHSAAQKYPEGAQLSREDLADLLPREVPSAVITKGHEHCVPRTPAVSLAGQCCCKSCCRHNDRLLTMRLLLRRSKNPAPLPTVKLIDSFDAAFGVVANNGTIWTINTDLDAPRSK